MYLDFSFNWIFPMLERIQTGFKKWRFGLKAQLAFLEDFYVLIKDGIPANRAIEMMARLNQGLVREVAGHISDKISQGQLLADGMEDWFAMNVVEIVRVGEESGQLLKTLQSALNMLSQQGVAVGEFAAACVYPLFILCVACGVVYYLDSSVFVQFKAIKPVSQWPDAGVQFLELAGFIKHWWWTVILAVVLLTVIVQKIMVNYTGALRESLDRVFPFSLYRQLVAARLLETIGLLVENGIVFKAAIKILRKQATPYLNFHLERIENLLGMGKTNIAEVLSTGLINPDDLTRLRIMAEVKGFEHGLVRIGIRGAEKAGEALKWFAKAMGGVLLMTDAYLILMIVRGIYLTGMAMGSQ